jgi:putative glutamine amidotransferase
MATQPLIGICAAPERARWSVWDQDAVVVAINYVAAVQRAGGLALLVPPDPELVEEPAHVIELLDALLLAGGADIDPEFYGAPTGPQTRDMVPARDAFEIAMARAAIEADMPVLGICRGMQLINVARGGTLTQHLPEHLGHEEHRRTLGSFDGSDHDVALAPGSLAERVAGEASHRAKSHHHQGIEEVGEGLVVSGRCPLDELPEAIELPEKRFVLGVQWHPEADVSSPVVGAFVAAAREAADDAAGARGAAAM